MRGEAEKTEKLTKAERAYVGVLFTQSYKKLYRVAFQHLHSLCADSIEDVIQETFRRACENYQTMSPYDSPEAWLVMTCRNVALDEVKRCCRITELNEETVDSDPSDQIGLDYILPADISPRDRDMLERYYVQGDTLQEIAIDVGEKPATIRKRICRLREQLKKKLEYN